MLVTVRHLHNSVMDLALFGDCDDLLHGCIRVTVAEVELESVIEEDSVLRNYTDVLPKRVKSEVFYVLAIDNHVSSLWVIYTE
jgi:hypothetical protein